MSEPFDLHQSSYDVLNGAQALRTLALDLAGRGDGDPISALERDTWAFTVSMMAEKAEACAEAWIDGFEVQQKAKRKGLQAGEGE